MQSPPALRHFLRIIKRKQRKSIILQYDCRTGGLCVWYWPINDAWERINPEILATDSRYRVYPPCCLCPYLNLKSRRRVGCDIIVAEDGPHMGEYVAICAFRVCNYLIPLDRLYNQPGLRIAKYPRITPTSPVVSTDARPTLSQFPVMSWSRVETDEFFRKLDSSEGVPEEAFLEWLVKCRCDRVMTKNIAPDHVCRPQATIIDLTGEESD